MADERNKRTEYNWSWSGDDAGSYRAKYTRGFDPDYVKHTAERREEQEENTQKKGEQAAQRQRRQRPSARRARLSAEQEVRSEDRPQRETEKTDRSRPVERPTVKSAQTRRTDSGKEKSAQTRRADSGKGKSAQTRRADPERGTAARARRADLERETAAQTRRADPEEERTAGTRRTDRGVQKRKPQTGRRSRRRNTGAQQAGARNRKSTAYRRQMLRRRYTILGIAAAAGIFFILLLLNTYSLTITLSGDNPLYLEIGETYQDPGATAIYRGSILHFGDKEVPVVSEHEINNRVCGTYEVTYHAEHKDQEATVKRTVIIPDRTAPVITLDESVNVVRKGDEWQDSFTATDDQDGDITANVEILGEVNMRRDGKYELTYRVQDSAGNEAEASRTVIVSSVAINRPEMARQGDKNVIYLTFDDGPGMYTERLLEILDSHNVKATFFVTDTNPGSRDLIGEEYRRGHTIGVHTSSHNYDLIYESAEAFWNDLDQEIEIIKEQTGAETSFMRYPGGSSNDLITMNDELRRELTAGMRARGLKYYDWTIDSYDSNDEYTSDDVYWALVDQTTVAEPKMVLCHDLKRTSVDAIDNYLSWAIENHYVFLPITEETPEVHHVDM